MQSEPEVAEVIYHFNFPKVLFEQIETSFLENSCY